MKFWLTQIVIFGLLITSVRIIKSVQFDMHCGSYMTRAANANTIAIAKDQMCIVVAYAESNGLTNGTTAVLWLDPNMDIGYWYNNMKSAYQELCSISPDASSLEKSNMLIKLRESLLTQGKDGAELDCPDNISLFPNNAFWIFILFLYGFDVIIGLVMYINYLELFD